MTDPQVLDRQSRRARRRGNVIDRKVRQAGRTPPDAATHADLVRRLAQAPQPLVDPRNRLIVIFSAKSACTTVVIWFLHHLGHLQAARDYSVTPHRYRERIYYKSAVYRGCLRGDLSGFRVIRVVRDPYERTVSMFRHALRFRMMDSTLDKLRRLSGAEPRLSFAGFLGRLEKMDLRRCDPHFQLQHHPVEDRLTPDWLIDISQDDLFERLREIEDDLGLPHSNLEKSAWVKERSARHRRAGESHGDVYNRPFSQKEANEGPWPDYEALLTPHARERIAKLYAADIRAYGTRPPAAHVAAPAIVSGAAPFEPLLAARPRPLINPDANLITLFSPKAACTTVVMWFFHHLGQGEAARAHGSWPHRYRREVYYPSDLYRNAGRLDLSGFTVVKVIRDPLDRAESAFRHSLSTNIAKEKITRVLRDPSIASEGLSFDRYLTFLERLDLTHCDPHVGVQRHPIEDVLPVKHLINISTQDLLSRLGEVERALGLPAAGPEFAEWLRTIGHHRRPQAEFPKADDLYTVPFTREQARNGPWPAAGAFMNAAARKRLEKLYAVDIRSYLQGSGA